MSGNQAIRYRYIFYVVVICMGMLCALNGCVQPKKSPENGIEEYILMLENPDRNVRLDAAEELRQMGPAAFAAVDALVVVCEDEDRYVRYDAVSALGQISHDRRVVEALFNRISVDDWQLVQMHAQCVLIGVIGAEAKDSIDLVINATKNDNEHVRKTAFMLLGEIGPEPGVISALLEGLERVIRDENAVYEREKIVTSLVGLGCAASSAIPILEEIGEIKAAASIRAACLEEGAIF